MAKKGCFEQVNNPSIHPSYTLCGKHFPIYRKELSYATYDKDGKITEHFKNFPGFKKVGIIS